MLSVEQENDAKRKRIDKDCYNSNQHYDRVKDGMKQDDSAAKRAELDAAYADISLMKQERQEALRAKMVAQREYLAYLYMQDDVKAGHGDTARAESTEYAAAQRSALERDMAEIQARLGNQAERIRELDAVHFVDNTRPKIVQRHWYNV